MRGPYTVPAAGSVGPAPAAVLIALLLLGSCGTFSYSVPGARLIPEDYFGVHPSNREGPPEKLYEFLDEMGVVWLRETFNWNSIEREQDLWDFSGYDELVENSAAAGKKILAILAYDVFWIHADNKSRRSIGPDQLPFYLRYVEEVVRHYRGKIHAYEIWNEPNWLFWKGNKKDFYDLTRAAAIKIRETDPDALIVAGAFNRVPQKFIREMFRAGALENVDALSFHPYDLGPRGALRLYDRFRNTLAAEGYTGDIWVTEVGYPTGGWYPTRVSENRFPGHVVKTLAGLAVRGAKICCWYQLFNSHNREASQSSLDSERYFGLAYPDYTRKKGAAAYALCGRYLAGTEYRPEFPVRNRIPSSVESLYFRGKDQRNTLIMWNRGIFPVRLKLRLPGTGQQIHDIVSGQGRVLEETTELTAAAGPVIITWTSGETGEGPALSRP
ncbi:MAG: hypothetical protein LBK27_07305 [Treponema sp.]|jgi:hypothetical protein|nr:hypothetical protein [Treponema sp.]